MENHFKTRQKMTILQYDPSRTKASLTHMLIELTDEALEYVWRPIVGAYNRTDNHNPKAMSKEDVNHYRLIDVAAHGSARDIAAFDDFGTWYFLICRG